MQVWIKASQDYNVPKKKKLRIFLKDFHSLINSKIPSNLIENHYVF